jgi:hypothetical protein
MDALRASTAFLPTIGIHHRRDDRANQGSDRSREVLMREIGLRLARTARHRNYSRKRKRPPEGGPWVCATQY